MYINRGVKISCLDFLHPCHEMLVLESNGSETVFLLSFVKYCSNAQTVKPIFHCDAKSLASGFGVGQNARILHWGYQHVGILEP